MFNATIPPGVNSDWPKSHSKNATLRYLDVIEKNICANHIRTHRVTKLFTSVLASVLLPVFFGPLMRHIGQLAWVESSTGCVSGLMLDNVETQEGGTSNG